MEGWCDGAGKVGLLSLMRKMRDGVVLLGFGFLWRKDDGQAGMEKIDVCVSWEMRDERLWDGEIGDVVG